MVDWVPLKTSVEGCRPALASFISRAAKRFWLGKSTYSHFTLTPYIFSIAARTSALPRTSSTMAWAMRVAPSALDALINSSRAAVLSAAMAGPDVTKQSTAATSSALFVPCRKFFIVSSFGRGPYPPFAGSRPL